MKYMKYICLMLIALSLIFVSCRKEENDVITGDVKNDTEISLLDENVNDEETLKSDVAETKVDENVKIDAESTMAPKEVAEGFGCVTSDGGEYNDDAIRLCEAIVSSDTEIFAEFTGGKSEYYDFLEKAEISSYTLYPIEFTEEKLAEMNESSVYPAAQDNYLVELDVESSECEEFRVGKSVYCFGLEMDPVAGNLLAFFVPAEMAEQSITTTYNADYITYFIEEFSALYPIQSILYDGRNYADSFDFSPHPHLITHLMARSGVYDEPPYTLEEVNEFITESFDGNEGLSISPINSQNWTSAGVVYPNDDPERIYGCSWGHGGTSVVCDVADVEKDGRSASYTVQIYADFSKVAKAYTLIFHFDDVENELPRLTMVERLDDTQRQPAVLSI